MKTTKLILMTMGLAAAMTACGTSNEENPTGSWTLSNPQSITEKIAGAESAIKTLDIDFNAPVSGEAGLLTLTSDYDVTVAATDSTAAQTYKVTATISGTWTQSVDDKDDYLLSFDRNSLKVSGVDAPELGPVTDDFINSLAPFSTIDDVEVSKDGKHMTFETSKPDVKYHFVSK